ncbi:uncharacterized protein C8R40DRAFT_1259175 [Lentinula edodes]|uniref:uncharacterized protein n=1 Tax=Lentinula edodes TaxID=5353 RepID=UPI001E8E38F0|nr:uncharacterized protein C8R40DRAFT_1259175 [Lentinula edodes]KAH7869615.1 hypothetical protein C8R40DRAFT_1259175 [Lentinula edodes]
MSLEDATVDTQQVCKLLDDMTASMASAREAIESLKTKGPSYFETKDGISLLSLKHHVLLSYMQSLLLVSTRRALGHSLSIRDPPSEPFSSLERSARGAGSGDLVDQMIEGRIVLEKVKVLEGRMRYQIEKLVKAAQQKGKVEADDIINDPLAFRPNPQNLLDTNVDDKDNGNDTGVAHSRNGDSNTDGIYRPPRVAPMPYVPQTSAKTKRQQRAPIPTSLASVLHTDGSMPHVESTSGLGNTPSLNNTSSRAKYLKHLTEFEEEQFGRVMMGKKEARRRVRDEEALALGGGLSGLGEEGKGRRQRTAGGWEDEFGDVLRDVERGSGRGLGGDGYDELRQRSKRSGVLQRSRENKKRSADSVVADADVPQKRKKSRFERERKGIKVKR